MAKDYDYPIYDAGGRVKKEKSPNKDLKYSGHNPGYQKYLDKQDFGTAFSASSEIDAIVGIIIIPTAMPAEIALKTPDPGIKR